MLNTTNPTPACDLVTLVSARFGELSVAETKLLEAASKGELAVCGPNDNQDDPANDPAKAGEWSTDREIRAELIRWLCVDGAAQEQVDPKGIRTFGARVVGKQDLSYVVVPFGLALQRCRLMEDAEFYSTELPKLDLQGTWVRSFNADRISVKGSIFLRDGFRAEGEVRLLGAQVSGNLDCGNSVFMNPSGDALSADRVNVKGDVFLDDGFRAEGVVRLSGAQIGGTLDCEKGAFTNSSKKALNASGIRVKGNIFLRDGFRAEGEVRLAGAQIEGDFVCIGSRINGQLVAQGLSVRGHLFWSGIANPEQARVDLRNGSVGALIDDIENWPPAGQLVLDGFTYARISAAEKGAGKRLKWLARQESFAPQPYRQLARVLREEGDEAGARRVLFEMELLRRQKEDRGRLERFWSGMLRRTIGFGYYPAKSLLWLLGLTVVSMFLTWGGYAVGSLAPADKEAYGPFKQSSQLPLHYDRFYPPVYALENSFPLVKLGQAERWQPDPNPQWQCSSPKCFSRLLCWVLSPVVLRGLRWCQICLGWFFTTMFVAGVSGIVRKD